ncbi:MAG: bifunctional phosphopantothenoylcysteine decarboxylase/phosphopantothenate--cysteine ligase CoaBC [Cytophagales bacterium]|nr:bifunctional phosphopantothenoylcysteine decarboxylase/phosphopantothenate--cysteine ligase CoaBC [Cytophagales bacterium]
MLTGKKILLAVTGSIAAYKAAFFVRLLVKSGADVKVVMTKAAKDFISPLTLATLSKNPVYSEYFKETTGEWNSHVELGLWADLMIVAPLTANTLAKLANGYCDNLLCATYLSARGPVMIAPAMDLDMYEHPSTRDNLDKLKSYGNILVEAEDGELASGLHGAGRMAEPEHLITHIQDHFEMLSSLKGKKVLITSGPTFEAIDPIRFIGNHSSGKMGAALAEAFVAAGATVSLVSGPSRNYPQTSDKIHLHQVQSAKEMMSGAAALFDDVDIAVFAAAVSDYGPKESATQKIKKSGGSLHLELVPNPDIALELGKTKTSQFTVGFALETNDEKVNAKEKLKKKNFDLIVLNSLNDKGAGFSHDTNKVSIFDKDNNEVSLELKSKKDVAQDIVRIIYDKIKI